MTAALPPDPAEVLTRLEEAHKAALHGPWIADGHEIYASIRGIPDIAGDWVGETCDIDDIPQSNANAAAIVAEHNAMPGLLAAVRGVLGMSVCQGAEEPFELHVRYCVPLAEQLTAVAAALGETGGGQ